MRKAMSLISLLIFALSATSLAVAAPAEGGKGKGKYYKSSKGKFEKLGKNVALEFTAESDGASETLVLNLASNFFEVKKHSDTSALSFSGRISLKEGVYLVTFTADWYLFGKSGKTNKGKSDIMFKGSVQMKDGEEIVLGKTGDVVFKLKISDVK